jgi:ketosteroid isomerase-like protein
MTFDAMAAAADWLDAYRAGDTESILEFYADDAVIECHSGGMKSITEKDGLWGYWLQRFKDYPASELEDLQPSSSGATISYTTREGAVSVVLEFNAEGKIALQRCGPSN